MAKFKTRYSELGFYVNGSLCRFNDGTYTTDDKDAIAALEALKDVERVDKPAEDKPADKPAKKSAKK